MKEAQKRAIKENDFFEVLSEENLKQRGVSSDLLKALRADPYQHHSRVDNGYLGILVANFLSRERGEAPESTERASAYLVAEAVGVPFESMLELHHEGRRIVEEATLNGSPDLYVRVGEAHIFVPKQTAEGLTDIATLYVTTRNPLYRNQLVDKAQSIVTTITGQFSRKLPFHVDLEDLTADANLGLLDAIEKFDPTKGFTFETYSMHRIRGTIQDGIRERDQVPRLDRKRMHEISSFAHTFREQQGTYPSRDDLKKEWARLDLPEQSFDGFYDRMWLGKMKIRSLNQPVMEYNGHARRIELGDRVPSRDNPLRNVQSAELLEIFEKDLLVLPENHRGLMRQLLLENVTMHEAGEQSDPQYSESRVSQLHSLYVLSGSFFKRTREYLGRKQGAIKLDL